ncbi:MAG: hypothetical protein AAGA55_02020 [Planctomycetota bacterium]
MPHLRLVTDEPETDPPAPLPIDAWRTPGRAASESTESLRDPIADVQHALERVQTGLDRLSTELDAAEPFPFPRRDDDDGPFAA